MSDLPRCPVTGQTGICPASLQQKEQHHTTPQCAVLTNTSSMYIYPDHNEQRTDKLYEFIDQYIYGTIVTFDENTKSFAANTLPFTLHDVTIDDVTKKVLRCHYPKAESNPQLAHLEALNTTKSTVLIMFNGPSAYISPTWYPSKKLNPTLVPTFNFTTVHITGSITLHDDPEWIYQQCRTLTQKTEAQLSSGDSQHVPWSIEDSPKSAMLAKIKRLIGIEVNITALQGKMKVSQDQSADVEGIAEGLNHVGQTAMASLVLAGGIDGCLKNSTLNGVFNHNVPNKSTVITKLDKHGNVGTSNYVNNNNPDNHTKMLYIVIIFLTSLVVQLLMKSHQ